MLLTDYAPNIGLHNLPSRWDSSSKGLKVLHITETPLSEAPGRLVYVQSKSSHISPRFALGTNAYHDARRTAFGTAITTEEQFEDFVDCLNKADVLHFHNRIKEMPLMDRLKVRHPELYERIISGGQCKIVVQYHSPIESVRRLYGETLAAVQEGVFKGLVVAQYQHRQYRQWCAPVPNAMVDYMGEISYWNDFVRTLRAGNFRFSGRTADKMPPVVSYFPSNRTGTGWDDKGYSSTIQALSGFLPSNLLVLTPQAGCIQPGAVIENYAMSDIVIDEVVTGSYHVATLEAMATGCIPISGMDSLTELALRLAFGMPSEEKVPWLITGKQNLYRELYALSTAKRNSPKWFQERIEENRRFFLKYWNYQNIARVYYDQYDAK